MRIYTFLNAIFASLKWCFISRNVTFVVLLTLIMKI